MGVEVAPLTEMVERALAQLSKLPPPKQDEVAAWLLAEFEDEGRWAAAFEDSQGTLEALADEALAEHRGGRTEPWFPEGPWGQARGVSSNLSEPSAARTMTTAPSGSWSPRSSIRPSRTVPVAITMPECYVNAPDATRRSPPPPAAVDPHDSSRMGRFPSARYVRGTRKLKAPEIDNGPQAKEHVGSDNRINGEPIVERAHLNVHVSHRQFAETHLRSLFSKNVFDPADPTDAPDSI